MATGEPGGKRPWRPALGVDLEVALAKFRGAGITIEEGLLVHDHYLRAVEAGIARGVKPAPETQWGYVAILEWVIPTAARVSAMRFIQQYGAVALEAALSETPPDVPPEPLRPPACCFHRERAAVGLMNGQPVCDECGLRITQAIRDSAVVAVAEKAADPAPAELDEQQVRAAVQYLVDRFIAELLPPPPSAPPFSGPSAGPRPVGRAAPPPATLRDRIRAAARSDDSKYQQYVEAIVRLKLEPGFLGDRELSAGAAQALVEDPQRRSLPTDLSVLREKCYRRFRTIEARVSRRLRREVGLSYTDAVEDAERVVERRPGKSSLRERDGGRRGR